MKDKNVPTSVGEFAVGERDQLLARLAELEQQLDDAGNWDAKQLRVIHGLHDDIAALKQPSVDTQCMCGGSPHTGQCLYEHFLSYSNLADQPLLRYAYFHGAGFAEEIEQPSAGVDERAVFEDFDESQWWCSEIEAIAKTPDQRRAIAVIRNLMGQFQKARAQLAAPAGVPDPTHAMILAGETQWESSGNAAPDVAAIYRAMLAAAPTPAPTVEPAKPEPIQVEAVAVTREDEDGELYLDWLLEGGIAALEVAGQTLLIAHGQITNDEGGGEVYTVEPAHSDDVSVPRELLERHIKAEDDTDKEGTTSFTLDAYDRLDATWKELRALLNGGRDA